MTNPSLTASDNTTQPFINIYPIKKYLADGDLVDITEIAEPLFKIPVYLSRRAWNEYVELLEKDDQVMTMRLKNIIRELWHAIHELGSLRPLREKGVLFEVFNTKRDNATTVPEPVTFECLYGDNDDRQPVIIILLADAMG